MLNVFSVNVKGNELFSGMRSSSYHTTNYKAASGFHLIRGAASFLASSWTLPNIAIRCTPAMAAGVTNTFWTVRDLVEMVEA